MPGRFGTTLPNGEVIEIGPKYRLGALYLEHGNVKIGGDSGSGVRDFLQNNLAHDMARKQRGFRSTSGGVKPFLPLNSTDWSIKNEFTHW